MNLESILRLSVSMRIKMQEELIICQTIFAFYLCIMKQFTRAYCQFPVCGPSRASMMFGYYPNATESYGYTSGREKVGEERISWSQLFKNNGYYTARVSKIFHMGISGDIPDGANGGMMRHPGQNGSIARGPNGWWKAKRNWFKTIQ